MATNKAIFIVGAKRTPFCKYGGSLRELPASKTFAVAAKDAMQSANIKPNFIDNTVIGNVFFLSQCDGGKTARYCGLYSGVPIERPALCVNKACGSGIQAIISASLDIKTGMSKMTLTGGTEIMSSLPLLVRQARFGISLGQPLKLEDMIKKQFVDSYSGLSLQAIAEGVANKYGISRTDVDEFARKSYLKWKAAQENKAFKTEMTSTTVVHKNKEITLNSDQISEISSDEDLTKLPPILDNGSIVTEGNSSMAADGAAALILCDEETTQKFGLRPLARIAGWALRGAGEGVGAIVEAIRGVAGEHIHNVDLFEINENFASETLATIKILGIDESKVNINGGSCTLGNPVAATGARMITHLAHQMRNSNLKRCIAASSCGGNQGIAVLLVQP